MDILILIQLMIRKMTSFINIRGHFNLFHNRLFLIRNRRLHNREDTAETRGSIFKLIGSGQK